MKTSPTPLPTCGEESVSGYSLGERLFRAMHGQLGGAWKHLNDAGREIYETGAARFLATLTHTEQVGVERAMLDSVLVEALKEALPLLEAWADDASNDVGACVQEGGKPTEGELGWMRHTAKLATSAREALALAQRLTSGVGR